MTKYQRKLAEVEQEKNRLINELQLINQDDTKSDISDNVKEQHKELVNTLHTKNKQLSDLLRDIEVYNSHYSLSFFSNIFFLD